MIKDIKYIVDALLESYEEHSEIIKIDTQDQLNRSVLIETLEKLRCVIFPGYFGKKNISHNTVEYYAGDLIEEIVFNLSRQIAHALRHRDEYRESSQETVSQTAAKLTFMFLEQLPSIRACMATDVSATFDGDPAAYSKDEIISSYPGLFAIMVYRLAHQLHELQVPLIPRIMTEYAHSITGIDIHHGACIGHHFFIDHGTGIVIGETTIIGNYVKLYQGVTLGGLSTRGGQSIKGIKRHPTIEDNVTIYSGASILGGQTVIGEGVVIGSNAFVTSSVPERTKVSVKTPELRFKSDEQNTRGQTLQADFLQADLFWDYVI
ncbi:MAG: serine acetyltransferase [Spirochaetaceae bacterium]|jgi:serine O-acetyltransferase|nr:serine acetyltransferase [Spirochaetaceae bacterium]